MNRDKLTIERVLYGDDSSLTLYRLSDGEIVNIDEAINYVMDGKLTGVVVGRDARGRSYIKPAGSSHGELR